MNIEDIFDEWDEDEDDDDFAELLENNVRAVNTTEAEDNEDEDESESEDDGSTFKCSKCKRRYHLKVWLQKHENSCSGKEPTKNCKVKLSEHQKKTRKVLSSLGFDDFFTSECVPSLITFLNKISASIGRQQFTFKTLRKPVLSGEEVGLLKKLQGSKKIESD